MERIASHRTARRIGTLPRSAALTEARIHKLLAEALKGCRKSRAEIAEELTSMSGIRVTEGMLNDWCRETKERLRFPLSLVRAICEITGNDDLAFAAMRDSLRERAELGIALHPFLKKWAERQANKPCGKRGK